MMIAVAIAGALLVYAWIMGYIGFSTERAGEAIQIPSVADDRTNTDLLVYVQNVGEMAVQLDENECLYVNGVLVDCTITGVTVSDKLATLEKGETAMLRYSGGAVLPGVKVKIKVTTLRGTSAEKYAYPAGSARAEPVLDHFEFDYISSPQIVGVAFDVTIRALDQYGNLFTSYVGNNRLFFPDSGTHWVGESFIYGVWTFNLTITGSYSNITIFTTALSDSSINGTSNAFDVVSWLVGWNYRKSHVIENATGAGTDYQVLIVVDYGSGVDGGDTVYLDGKCRTDFGDIRFTDDDRGTELDYWIENYTTANRALFWVEVADNLSISDATIYIYYGNDAVSTTSNGENTFLLFDDFDGSSLDGVKWQSDRYVSVSDGEVHIYSVDSGDSSFISSYDTYLYNVATRFKSKNDYSGITSEGFRTLWTPQDFVGLRYHDPNYMYLTTNEEASTNTAESKDAGYYTYEVCWVNEEAIFYRNNIFQATHTTNLPDEAIPIRHATDEIGASIYVDWVFVRKFVSPEPVHGSWGEEEILISG
jgi:hypothetical protein